MDRIFQISWDRKQKRNYRDLTNGLTVRLESGQVKRLGALLRMAMAGHHR